MFFNRGDSAIAGASNVLQTNADTKSIASEFTRTPSVANFTTIGMNSSSSRGVTIQLAASGSGTLTKRFL